MVLAFAPLRAGKLLPRLVAQERVAPGTARHKATVRTVSGQFTVRWLSAAAARKLAQKGAADAAMGRIHCGKRDEVGAEWALERCGAER